MDEKGQRRFIGLSDPPQKKERDKEQTKEGNDDWTKADNED